MADNVKDETTRTVGDPSKETLTPEMKSALETGTKVSELLKIHGVESVDDLGKNLETLSNITKNLGDQDLAEVMKKASTLDQYEAYWAEQETKRTITNDESLDDDDKRDKEIAALKSEIREIKDSKAKEISDARSKQEAQAALDAFTKEINTFIKENNVPEEYQPFIKDYFGLTNPFNEIEDISDPVAVRKMLNSGAPKVEAFEQAIIKRYLDGKIKIPEITETKPADPLDDMGITKPKNLKEARNAAKEYLGKAFGRKSG